MKPSRFFPRFFLWPFAVSVVISYFLLNLLGCSSTSAGKTGSLLPTDTAGMIEAVFSTDAQMQAEQTFPIPMKEYDASVLPNNYLAFTAYKGQARIYFWAHGLASFDLYINLFVRINRCALMRRRISKTAEICSILRRLSLRKAVQLKSRHNLHYR